MCKITIGEDTYEPQLLETYIVLLKELLEGKRELGNNGLCWYLRTNTKDKDTYQSPYDLMMYVMYYLGYTEEPIIYTFAQPGELTEERKQLATETIKYLEQRLGE